MFVWSVAAVFNLLSEKLTGSSDKGCYISQLARVLYKGNGTMLETIFKPCAHKLNTPHSVKVLVIVPLAVTS